MGDIIKSLRKKTSDGYSKKIDIGADLKNISALLNSNNNNLEEQFILGLDCVIDEWEVSNNKHILKRYFDYCKDTSNKKGHYYIYEINYNKINKSEIDFANNNTVIFTKTPSVAIQLKDNAFCLSFNNISANKINYEFRDNFEEERQCSLIIAPTRKLLKEERLYFRPSNNIQKDADPETYLQNNNYDVLISVKETYQGNTLNNNNITTKTIISRQGNALGIFSNINIGGGTSNGE